MRKFNAILLTYKSNKKRGKSMEIRYFMKKIKLPEDCIDYISALYAKIKDDVEFRQITEDLEKHMPTHEINNKLTEYSSLKKLNTFEVCLAFICSAGNIFKSRYDEKGISDDIFWDCMQDIRYKAYECKKTYGVWGISCFGWYDGYFNAYRYELGRLQFEHWSFEQESYTFGDTTIKKGDLIVNIHIPSSGPLIPEAVLDSLKRAYDFMEYKHNNKMFLICKSWLLYPAYKNLFGENSNIRKFIDLFDIFDSVKDESFAFGYGPVFNTDKTNDISALPQDTSLQRSFVAYMKDKNADYGRGYGMIVVEDGKIIN